MLTTELSHDRSRTEIGRHGEVGQRRGDQDDHTNVVEGALAPWTLYELVRKLYKHCNVDQKLTKKVRPVMQRKQNATRENAAHNQSEPFVLMWSCASGGLMSTASLPSRGTRTEGTNMLSVWEVV